MPIKIASEIFIISIGFPVRICIIKNAAKIFIYEQIKYNIMEFSSVGEFRQYMFSKLGIEDNPKREQLFLVAWEFGHVDGYDSMMNYAEDMVCLIR